MRRSPAPTTRSRRRVRWAAPILVLVGLAMLTAADQVEAARASADVVLVREGEIVDEDLYAVGNTITIDGTIEGDLVLWAFDRLDIRGTVEGDVVGWAPTARITGSVGGSVRLIGIDIVSAGEVGADLFAAGWSVETGGSIGRDVLSWSRSLDVGGTVGRDVEGQTWGSTVISGSVGRDVEMTARSLRITNGAFVGQDVGVRSFAEPELDPEATVGGTVIRRVPVSPNVSVSAARFVAAVLGLIGFIWIGILAIWLLPATMQRSVIGVETELRRSFLAGIAALITPVLLLVTIIVIAAGAPPELALTIISVSAPIWLGLLAALLLSMVIAPVPVLIVLGRRLSNGRWSAFGSFSILAVPLALIVLFIPYVRWLVGLGVVAVGLGSLATAAFRGRGSLQWATGQMPEEEIPDTTTVGDDDSPVLYAVDPPESGD